jgi:hypothetical protein
LPIQCRVQVASTRVVGRTRQSSMRAFAAEVPSRSVPELERIATSAIMRVLAQRLAQTDPPRRIPALRRPSVYSGMKSPIDLKSFAFGGLIAALFALSVAAATGPATGSRFQVSAWGFAGQGTSGHGAYVVDTTTGELWVVSEGGMQRKLVEKLK